LFKTCRIHKQRVSLDRVPYKRLRKAQAAGRLTDRSWSRK
jgi:hypothetical protein